MCTYYIIFFCYESTYKMQIFRKNRLRLSIISGTGTQAKKKSENCVLRFFCFSL